MRALRERRGWKGRIAAIAASGAVALAASDAYAQPAPPAAPAPPTPSAQGGKREPSAGDLATARTALREGLSLREKGDLTGALARLTSAYDLVQTPITGFELGKTQMLLGHVLQAHELFAKVVRMPPSLEESSRSQQARDEAARLSRELEPRIPTLRLKLTVPPGASAVVRIDDEPIPLTGAETMRAVDPGPHDVVAKAGDGPELKVHVELAETEVKDVPLAPKWVAPKAPPATGKATQIIFVQQTNPLAFIGFGIAAASLVVTGVSGYIASQARSDARDRCAADYCPPSVTLKRSTTGAVLDPRFDTLTNRANVATLVAVIGGVSAVVFVAVGIIGASRPIKEKVTAELHPVVGPGGAGLTGTF